MVPLLKRFFSASLGGQSSEPEAGYYGRTATPAPIFECAIETAHTRKLAQRKIDPLYESAVAILDAAFFAIAAAAAFSGWPNSLSLYGSAGPGWEIPLSGNRRPHEADEWGQRLH